MLRKSYFWTTYRIKSRISWCLCFNHTGQVIIMIGHHHDRSGHHHIIMISHHHHDHDILNWTGLGPSFYPYQQHEDHQFSLPHDHCYDSNRSSLNLSIVVLSLIVASIVSSFKISTLVLYRTYSTTNLGMVLFECLHVEKTRLGKRWWEIRNR